MAENKIITESKRPVVGGSQAPSSPSPSSSPPVHAPVHRADGPSSQHQPEHQAEHQPAHDRKRTRIRNAAMENPFDLPLDQIPSHLSYEWKRWSVVGQHDPFYISQMRKQGWEPVRPSAHPDWVPPGYSEDQIVKGGMILMERPKELTQEAIEEMHVAAKREVSMAEQRLGMTPRGEATRDLPEVRPRISKEVVRMVVEE
jgi:hypothetical protein